MGKKPVKRRTEYRPDASKLHEPVDKTVKLPHQVRHAAEVANARALGQPSPPSPGKEVQRSGFPHTDEQIDQALQRLQEGELQLGDPAVSVIRDLAVAGVQHIKSRRRGARQPRENSDTVTQRMEALLQAYRELSSRMQAHPTGSETIRKLRQSVIKKLALRDDDEVISEDTIKHDIQQLGPIFRSVREGIVPPPGPKPAKQKFSKETQKEMVAGKKALAKHRAHH
jgi:soluble cytochrome b562